MVKNVRVTYRRRHSYATKSNGIRVVKTPGGKLVAQTRKKAAAGPKCGDCKQSLKGIKHLSPKEYKNVSKTHAHGRPRLRWLALRQVRPLAHCACLPH
ncbi:hypothetical protein PINS_up022596 [Pythium insidiosum]|nr:hypothetical protein PINS_up022596 [Pythium insidiosum]